MTTTTLSTKGQIIIPKEVRERHGWAPGLALEILEQGDSVVLRPVSRVPATTVDDLLGCLLENLTLEDAPAVLRALEWHGRGMDFADALHLMPLRSAPITAG